jgi:phage terminase large subunit-like protein
MLGQRTVRQARSVVAATVMLPVVGAYGDAIIAERNFGGAMIAETLRHADPIIPIREPLALN